LPDVAPTTRRRIPAEGQELDDTVCTVSIDINGATNRVVGDRVHVIFDEDENPLRLTLEPDGDWTVVAVEPFELPRNRPSLPAVGTRLTLRRAEPLA
jgi:hypothetical protein